MIIYDRLWKQLKHKNLTRYYLVRKTGLDWQTIRRLESNEIVRTSSLDKICTALNCDIEDIMQFIPPHKDA